MEHVTEAIKQAESDLVDTREELRMARELVASLEQDAKRIEIELVGLRSYAQRRGLAEVETVVVPGVASLDQRRGAGGAVVPISPNVAVVAQEQPDLLLMSRNEAVVIGEIHSQSSSGVLDVIVELSPIAIGFLDVSAPSRADRRSQYAIG